MKSSESTFRKILSALLSGTMLMGVMSAAAVAMPGSISIPVAALGDEGEGPLIPPDDPVDPDDAPDPDQEYSEEFDVRVEVKKSSGGIDLPFIPAPTACGTFDNGVKWEYYAQGVMGDAHLYFATATASNSDIPASAITTIYSTRQDAIKKSKSFSMALIKNIGDNAFDTSLAHIVGKLDLKTLSFDKIETIGIRAFAGFKDIKDIVFPESLVSIGSEAFNEVNTTITFSGTKSIEFGKDAFKKLNDKQSVVIPYGSTYNDGETVVTIVPENNKYAAVFGKATVTVKDEYTCFPEVPATCTTSGTIEYYRDCKGDYFVKDGDSYTKITKADTVTDPLGHKCEEYNYKWAGVFVQKADDSYPEKPNYLELYKEYGCTVCDEYVSEKQSLKNMSAAATCTRNKKTIYWFDYVDSNNETQRQIRQITRSAALGHDYGEPVYVWADDYSTCTATRVCTRDESHYETETADATGADDPDDHEKIIYTAVFENEAFGTATQSAARPAFIFDDDALSMILSIDKEGGESQELDENLVAISEGSYTIYAFSPLSFSREPDEQYYSDDMFEYSFELSGTEVIYVTICPSFVFSNEALSSVTFIERENGDDPDLGNIVPAYEDSYIIQSTNPLLFSRDPDSQIYENDVFRYIFDVNNVEVIYVSTYHSFVFSEDALENVISITRDYDDDLEPERIVPVDDYDYEILSSVPLSFTREPDAQEYGEDGFWYLFVLNGTEVIYVSNLPSFVFTDEALDGLVEILRDNDESPELNDNVIPIFEDNYSIISSVPLSFSTEPDGYDYESGCYTYWFDLDGSEFISVEAVDLPAITFNEQLADSDKINELRFIDDDSVVDPDTYENLAYGDYLLTSTVELDFLNLSDSGEDVEITNQYYAAGCYFYFFTVNSDTGDIFVAEASVPAMALVSLEITDYGNNVLSTIEMLQEDSDSILIYSQDQSAPEYIQAGKSYKLVSSRRLFITGADVSNKSEGSDQCVYTVSVPEGSEDTIVIDNKDITNCDVIFYDSDDNEIDVNNLVYTGEDLTPVRVVVVDRDYTLVEGIDYNIDFSGNWTEVTENVAHTDLPRFTIEGLNDYSVKYLSLLPEVVTVTIQAPETVTVTFDSQGGTEIDPQTVNYKGKATLPEVPEKDGFDFVGWYYGDEPFDFEMALVGNITLTAQWVDELLNFSVIDQEAIQLGKAITVTAIAEGGTAPYTYAVSYKKHSSSTWTVKQDFNENDTVVIRPAYATSYDILVTVKDSKGITAEEKFEVNVFDKLVNTSEVAAENIAIGSEAVVNASAEGGLGEYEFAVFFKRADETNWRMLQDYDANTQVSFKPAYNTLYNVMVRVRDERGVVVKRELRVNVFKPKNTSTVTEEVLQGQTIDVVCSAEDGYGECTYAVYYKKASASNWKMVQDYSENTEVSITPPAPGEYNVAVKVKDEFGTIVRSIIDVNVCGLVNTTQLSSYDLDGPGSVTVYCSAEGTTDDYEYAVYYRQAGETKWKTAQAYSENAEVEINLDSAGDWDICVKVRDSLGNIAKYYETVAVQDA